MAKKISAHPYVSTSRRAVSILRPARNLGNAVKGLRRIDRARGLEGAEFADVGAR
jgi:hypothetical protein